MRLDRGERDSALRSWPARANDASFSGLHTIDAMEKEATDDKATEEEATGDDALEKEAAGDNATEEEAAGDDATDGKAKGAKNKRTSPSR